MTRRLSLVLSTALAAGCNPAADSGPEPISGKADDISCAAAKRVKSAFATVKQEAAIVATVNQLERDPLAAAAGPRDADAMVAERDRGGLYTSLDELACRAEPSNQALAGIESHTMASCGFFARPALREANPRACVLWSVECDGSDAAGQPTRACDQPFSTHRFVLEVADSGPESASMPLELQITGDRYQLLLGDGSERVGKARFLTKPRITGQSYNYLELTARGSAPVYYLYTLTERGTVLSLAPLFGSVGRGIEAPIYRAVEVPAQEPAADPEEPMQDGGEPAAEEPAADGDEEPNQPPADA